MQLGDDIVMNVYDYNLLDLFEAVTWLEIESLSLFAWFSRCWVMQ